MTAYVIVEVDVTDPEAYKRYIAANAAAFRKYGARFLVRGGAYRVAEGESRSRNVVIEFPDVAAARTWYHSPEYGEAKATRAGAATGRFFVVEGVE